MAGGGGAWILRELADQEALAAERLLGEIAAAQARAKARGMHGPHR